MNKKNNRLKVKDIPIYEHLEQSLKLTYAQRLRSLEEMWKFAYSFKKSKK